MPGTTLSIFCVVSHYRLLRFFGPCSTWQPTEGTESQMACPVLSLGRGRAWIHSRPSSSRVCSQPLCHAQGTWEADGGPRSEAAWGPTASLQANSLLPGLHCSLPSAAQGSVAGFAPLGL